MSFIEITCYENLVHSTNLEFQIQFLIFRLTLLGTSWGTFEPINAKTIVRDQTYEQTLSTVEALPDKLIDVGVEFYQVCRCLYPFQR